MSEVSQPLREEVARNGGSTLRTTTGYELCLSEELHGAGLIHPHVIAQGLYEDERDVETPLTIVTACSCGQQVASETLKAPPGMTPEEWDAWDQANLLSGQQNGYRAFREHVGQLHPASLKYWPTPDEVVWTPD